MLGPQPAARDTHKQRPFVFGPASVACSQSRDAEADFGRSSLQRIDLVKPFILPFQNLASTYV